MRLTTLYHRATLKIGIKESALALSICVFMPVVLADVDNISPAQTSFGMESLFRKELIFINGQFIPAIIIDGTHLTVDASSPISSYGVINNGQLNLINGAVVGAVKMVQATLNATGSSITQGILAFDGSVKLSNSVVGNSNGVGMVLGAQPHSVKPGSTGIIITSVISGLDTGIQLSPRSELWLSESSVEGFAQAGVGGFGIRVAGGVIHVGGGSSVSGAMNAIVVANGSVSASDEALGLVNRVEVDGSTLTSNNGAAIRVERAYNDGSINIADILITRDSRLVAGNGVILDVEQDSEVNFKVDHSQLFGDLVADASAILDVVFDNSASLSGNIYNAHSVGINLGSYWQFSGDSQLGSLSLSGGRVRFDEEGFHTLSLGELSGNGTFDMRINLGTAQGDLLQVNGQATGSHLLNVKNTGVEVVPAEFDPLRIVHTEGGDARFGLIGNRVDLGAYSYLLEKQGNDWFIVGEGKTISPSTQSALALFNAAPAIWNSELTTLRSRMGEVRGQEEGGGWIRSYGNRFDASTGAGLSYHQKQQGMSFGADAPIPVANGNLVMGLMGGYSKSDLDLSGGSSGTVNSYYVGAYGTWLLNEGYYLDGVLKFNRFRNESKVAMSDGGKAKGRYNNEAVGASIEFGKHIQLADDYFVEPYTQLSGVSIGGNSYLLSNGMKAKNSGTQSVLGKVGTTAGRNFALDDGSIVQPYVRVAMAHEFARSNDVTVNEAHFDNNLFGSRAELGTGIAVSLSKRLQLHADFDYMKGKHVEQPWGANLGLKLAF